MPEDDLLTLSLGSLPACGLWAHAQMHLAPHWDFVRLHCSGVLCMDAVHDRGRTMRWATEPLGDCPVSFKVVDTNDQAPMAAVLQPLKERGLDAQVIIPDGAPL